MIAQHVLEYPIQGYEYFMGKLIGNLLKHCVAIEVTNSENDTILISAFARGNIARIKFNKSEYELKNNLETLAHDTTQEFLNLLQ